MSFDRPLALLSLAVLPALVLGFVLLRKRRARYPVRFTNVEVLRGVSGPLSSRREWVVGGLLLAVLGLLCLALARPHVNRIVPVENATVVLVVDTSRSMLSDDIAPSRLEAAKAAAQAFLDRIPDRLRVGLVTFAGEPTVAAVPTHDHTVLHDTIDAINPFQSGGGGTAIGDALARSVELARDSFRGGAVPAGDAIPGVTILFLSDGRQFRGILPPEAGAAMAARAGIPVYTVALGTDDPGWSGRDLRIRPVARPRHAAHDRGDDRRRVLRGSLGPGALVGVRRPGLAARPRRAADRGDVPPRRRRGPRSRGRRASLAALGAGISLIRGDDERGGARGPVAGRRPPGTCLTRGGCSGSP